jgi:hypothetical protein
VITTTLEKQTFVQNSDFFHSNSIFETQDIIKMLVDYKNSDNALFVDNRIIKSKNVFFLNLLSQFLIVLIKVNMEREIDL